MMYAAPEPLHDAPPGPRSTSRRRRGCARPASARGCSRSSGRSTSWRSRSASTRSSCASATSPRSTPRPATRSAPQPRRLPARGRRALRLAVCQASDCGGSIVFVCGWTPTGANVIARARASTAATRRTTPSDRAAPGRRDRLRPGAARIARAGGGGGAPAPAASSSSSSSSSSSLSLLLLSSLPWAVAFVGRGFSRPSTLGVVGLFLVALVAVLTCTRPVTNDGGRTVECDRLVPTRLWLCRGLRTAERPARSCWSR